jgi:secretion/DNA translocation related TadE-like protein
MSRDEGSGSVMALGLVAATTAVVLAVLVLAAGLAARQSVIGTADAAALAAADTASGAVPGDPCERAEHIAGAAGARLRSCRIDGLIVTVDVSGTFAGVTIRARSAAGPPP